MSCKLIRINKSEYKIVLNKENSSILFDDIYKDISEMHTTEYVTLLTTVLNNNPILQTLNDNGKLERVDIALHIYLKALSTEFKNNGKPILLDSNGEPIFSSIKNSIYNEEIFNNIKQDKFSGFTYKELNSVRSILLSLTVDKINNKGLDLPQAIKESRDVIINYYNSALKKLETIRNEDNSTAVDNTIRTVKTKLKNIDEIFSSDFYTIQLKTINDSAEEAFKENERDESSELKDTERYDNIFTPNKALFQQFDAKVSNLLHFVFLYVYDSRVIGRPNSLANGRIVPKSEIIANLLNILTENNLPYLHSDFRKVNQAIKTYTGKHPRYQYLDTVLNRLNTPEKQRDFVRLLYKFNSKPVILIDGKVMRADLDAITHALSSSLTSYVVNYITTSLGPKNVLNTKALGELITELEKPENSINSKIGHTLTQNGALYLLNAVGYPITNKEFIQSSGSDYYVRFDDSIRNSNRILPVLRKILEAGKIENSAELKNSMFPIVKLLESISSELQTVTYTSVKKKINKYSEVRNVIKYLVENLTNKPTNLNIFKILETDFIKDFNTLDILSIDGKSERIFKDLVTDSETDPNTKRAVRLQFYKNKNTINSNDGYILTNPYEGKDFIIGIKIDKSDYPDTRQAVMAVMIFVIYPEIAQIASKQKFRNISQTLGYQLFQSISSLNTLNTPFDIYEEIDKVSQLDLDKITFHEIRNILSDEFKNIIYKEVYRYVEAKKNEYISSIKNNIEARIKILDNYESDKELERLALNFVIDHLRTNFVVDLLTNSNPAVFTKLPTELKSKTIEQFRKKINDVKAGNNINRYATSIFSDLFEKTYENYVKRRSMLVTLGNQRITIDTKLDFLNKTHKRYLVLPDPKMPEKSDTEKAKSLEYQFFNSILGSEVANQYENNTDVNIADAAEIISWRSNLVDAFKQGLSTDIKKIEILAKELEVQEKELLDENRTEPLTPLSDEAKAILNKLLHVEKNVVYDESNGNVVGVKSAAGLVLLPELAYKNPFFTEYYKKMLETDADAIVYPSAMKFGVPDDLNVTGQAIVDVNDSSVIKSQNVPNKDKNEINNPTQKDKNLIIGVDKILGPEVHRRILKVFDTYNRSRILKLQKHFRQKGKSLDLKRLSNLLIREAKERKWPTELIKELEVNINNNNLKNPLLFSNIKIQYFLSSILNKLLVKHKTFGKSYVQVPSLGTDNLQPDGYIKLTRSYDGKLKGPRYVKKDVFETTGKEVLPTQKDYNSGNITYRPPQIIVPWNFRDAQGRLIDINKYLDKDGIITNIDPKVLIRLGLRIPNGDYTSNSSFEIVGFLPNTYNNIVFTPHHTLIQMGSDFDLDKLYTLGSYIEEQKIKDDNGNTKTILAPIKKSMSARYQDYASTLLAIIGNDYVNNNTYKNAYKKFIKKEAKRLKRLKNKEELDNRDMIKIRKKAAILALVSMGAIKSYKEFSTPPVMPNDISQEERDILMYEHELSIMTEEEIKSEFNNLYLDIINSDNIEIQKKAWTPASYGGLLELGAKKKALLGTTLTTYYDPVLSDQEFTFIQAIERLIGIFASYPGALYMLERSNVVNTRKGNNSLLNLKTNLNEGIEKAVDINTKFLNTILDDLKYKVSGPLNLGGNTVNTLLGLIAIGDFSKLSVEESVERLVTFLNYPNDLKLADKQSEQLLYKYLEQVELEKTYDYYKSFVDFHAIDPSTSTREEIQQFASRIEAKRKLFENLENLSVVYNKLLATNLTEEEALANLFSRFTNEQIQMMKAEAIYNHLIGTANRAIREIKGYVSKADIHNKYIDQPLIHYATDISTSVNVSEKPMLANLDTLFGVYDPYSEFSISGYNFTPNNMLSALQGKMNNVILNTTDLLMSNVISLAHHYSVKHGVHVDVNSFKDALVKFVNNYTTPDPSKNEQYHLFGAPYYNGNVTIYENVSRDSLVKVPIEESDFKFNGNVTGYYEYNGTKLPIYAVGFVGKDFYVQDLKPSLKHVIFSLKDIFKGSNELLNLILPHDNLGLYVSGDLFDPTFRNSVTDSILELWNINTDFIVDGHVINTRQFVTDLYLFSSTSTNVQFNILGDAFPSEIKNMLGLFDLKYKIKEAINSFNNPMTIFSNFELMNLRLFVKSTSRKDDVIVTGLYNIPFEQEVKGETIRGNAIVYFQNGTPVQIYSTDVMEKNEYKVKDVKLKLTIKGKKIDVNLPLVSGQSFKFNWPIDLDPILPKPIKC